MNIPNVSFERAAAGRIESPGSFLGVSSRLGNFRLPSGLSSSLRQWADRVGPEVKANFTAWLERHFVNDRAGRIGTTSYDRAGQFDDVPGDRIWYQFAYERALLDHTEPLTKEEWTYLLSEPLILTQLALGITDARGLRCYRRGLTGRINALQRKAYQRRYYAANNARRRLLAAERRRITHRTTANPCPTPEALNEAFAHVGDSPEAKIRFGGMLQDLECYVDNCLRIDANGEIVGRNSGIKGWLAQYAPALHARYKTVMRYKALAKRVRQLTGLHDPVPTDAVFDGKGESADGNATEMQRETHETSYENYSADKSHHGWKMLKQAREKLDEVLAGCDNTVTGLFRCLDDALEQADDS